MKGSRKQSVPKEETQRDSKKLRVTFAAPVPVEEALAAAVADIVVKKPIAADDSDDEYYDPEDYCVGGDPEELSFALAFGHLRLFRSPQADSPTTIIDTEVSGQLQKSGIF